MSSLGNKEVMAKNLKYYIERSGKDRRELAETWGFPYSTVTEWINGRKYPRIDRIEIMADYFGILKSDLIEDKPKEYREMSEKNKRLVALTMRLRTDDDFLSVVEDLDKLDADKLNAFRQMLSAFV